MGNKRRKSRKPSAPRKIAEGAKFMEGGQLIDARNPEGWGVNREALRLPANVDVAVEDASRTKVKRVTRLDVFELMFIRRSISQGALDGVRRLQEDIAILHRSQGASDAIRTIGSTSRPDGLSLAQRAAGERIHELAGRMRPWAFGLVLELAEREAVHGVIPDWRKIVAHRSRIHNRRGQADHLIAATESVAEAYREIDNEPRRAVG